jgi:hypothetical protein
MPTLQSLVQAQVRNQQDSEKKDKEQPASPQISQPPAGISADPKPSPFGTPVEPEAEPETPTDPTADPSGANPVDANGDGMISPEELFQYFDSDGDGTLDMTDFAAHILFHIYNPAILKPYMAEAKKKMDVNKESYARLANRLQEVTLISKADPTANDKAKAALNGGEDVRVIDKDKINQLKIQEEFNRWKSLAGIK